MGLAEWHLGEPGRRAVLTQLSPPLVLLGCWRPHGPPPQPRPGKHPCPLAPPPWLPHTHPFADQVVGEVSGQHVRTQSPSHVLTVNLGTAGQAGSEAGGPGS